MTWLESFSTWGGHYEDGIALDFGDAAAERSAALTGPVLAPLAGYGVLRFSGADATTFLHGQVSCDLKQLPPTACRQGGYSTPKGRMLASPLFWRSGDDWYALLPRSLCEPIRKRLAMYIMRSKVQAEDLSAQWAVLGLSGATASQWVVQRQPSAAQNSNTALAGGHLLHWRDNVWILVLPISAVATVWADWTQQARAVGESVWEWQRIRAGLPMVVPATQEQYVPQMTNLDLLEGISYTKGCYPGQEIVARTHYLGKVKRRMALVHSTVALTVGDSVYSPATEAQACGSVAAAEPSATGGWDALVVAQLDHIGNLHLQGPTGPDLTPLPTPYPLEQPT